MLDPKEIAQMHIEQAARGLDLVDADDRATFRRRLFDSYHMTRVHFVVAQALALGAEVPCGGWTRDKAQRAVARQHLSSLGLPV